MQAAAWLQDSAVAQALRAGAYAYPLVNLAHVLGIALLFGAVAVLDLRLMGLWRGLPVAAFARPLVSVAAFGLALAVATGLLLVTVRATEYVRNPFLYLKFAAIAVGAINVALTHRLADWGAAPDEPTPRLRLAGAVSLVSWLIAVAAGRFIAYW